MPHRMLRRSAALAALIAASIFVGSAQATVPLTQVVGDQFANPESQHDTAVEPDTFAFGGQLVVAAQSGRYFSGGASGTGWGTLAGFGGELPGLTDNALEGGGTNGGSADRATDPVVAYDAAHNVWMVSSLLLDEDASGAAGGTDVVINRSTDGGASWSGPVTVAAAVPGVTDYDKNWVVCDTHSGSPFYGRCYHTWDDFGDGDRILMSTSTDGGLTWSAPAQTQGGVFGLGGQPVVQPNGTVIVPAANAFETAIIAFRSTNGGASWGDEVVVDRVPSHTVAGNLRSGPLPSAEIDASGTVYVAWQDCRFRKGCKSNDLVWTSSENGTTWTAIQRVPIGTVTDGSDHFIPGLGVNPSSGGAGAQAQLGLTYYSYDNARCARSKKAPRCALAVDYVQSNNGGATWSSPQRLVDPFPVAWTPDTSQGRMVGDYISTSWLNGRAYGAFAVATAAPNPTFHQAIYVPTGGVLATGFTNAANAADKAVVRGSTNENAVFKPARR